MKNLIKVFGIIAIVAVIGLTMLACNKSGSSSGSDSSKSSGGGGKTLNSPEALKEYLDKQPANSPDKPIKVSMGTNELMLPKIRDVLNSAGKYVSLNLTGNALTTIPEGAFKECKTLTSLTIPNSVTSIGAGSFSDCENITSVTIPNSVTSIGDYAFGSCTITSVTIPNSVTSIGDRAFWFCTSLTAITVDAANTAYSSDSGVLYNKAKTELIQYPAGKTGSSFTIPNSVTSIGYFAFSGCTSLTSVTIPDSVTSIGDYAFAWCTSLTNINIPKSVTSIGNGAFYGCESLTSVTFQGTTVLSEYSSFDGDLPEKYLAGGTGTYIVTGKDERDDHPVWTKK
jgi:hypothetical protein